MATVLHLGALIAFTVTKVSRLKDRAHWSVISEVNGTQACLFVQEVKLINLELVDIILVNSRQRGNAVYPLFFFYLP